MANYGDYTTLHDFKARKVAIEQTDTGDDEIIKSYISTASRMLDGTCHRHFYPLYAARYYDMPPDDSLLKLDADLLEVDTFTTSNTGTSISSSDYYLMCGRSYNLSPYDRILMKTSGSQPNLLYTGTVQKSQAVTGWWGYHEDWSNAWVDTQDDLAAAISSATATTFTVADADGADILGNRPRFKVGQLLKIDTEYMYLAAIKSNTLTIIRGVNGTTAATHTISTSIYVYAPMREIAQGALRLAQWLYGQKDAGYQSRIAAALARGTIEIPENAPGDVLLIAARYKARRVTR